MYQVKKNRFLPTFWKILSIGLVFYLAIECTHPEEEQSQETGGSKVTKTSNAKVRKVKPSHSYQIQTARTFTGGSPASLLRFTRGIKNGKSLFQTLAIPNHADAYSFPQGNGPSPEPLNLDKLSWNKTTHKVREKHPYFFLAVNRTPSGDPEAFHRHFNITKIYDTSEYTATNNRLRLMSEFHTTFQTPPAPDLVSASVKSRSMNRANSGVGYLGSQEGSSTSFNLERGSKDHSRKKLLKLLDTTIKTSAESFKSTIKSKFVEPVQYVKQTLPGKASKSVEMEQKLILIQEGYSYPIQIAPRHLMLEIYNNAFASVRLIKDLAERSGRSFDDDRKTKLIDRCNLILDPHSFKAAVAQRGGVNLSYVEPHLPSTASSNLSAGGVHVRHQVAKGIDRVFHNFAKKLDSVRKDLAGARAAQSRRLAEVFLTWSRSQNPSLKDTGAILPILNYYDNLLSSPALDHSLLQFSRFAAQASVNSMTDLSRADRKSMFKSMRAGLVYQLIGAKKRQIESAGSIAKSIWFQDFHQHLFGTPMPKKFAIETFERITAIRPEHFNQLTEKQKVGADPIRSKHALNFNLFNRIEASPEYASLVGDRIGALDRELEEIRTGIFMRFAREHHKGKKGFNYTRRSDYVKFLKQLTDQPPKQAYAVIGQLNRYTTQQGVKGYEFTIKSLANLNTRLFTPEVREKTASGYAVKDKKMKTYTSYLEKLHSTFNAIADERSRHIYRQTRRRGYGQIGWRVPPTDFVDASLKMLKGSKNQPVTPAISH